MTERPCRLACGRPSESPLARPPSAARESRFYSFGDCMSDVEKYTRPSY
ncbi:MAG: hypothetical protein AAB502_03475 [Chloroflexota bacterium]